MTDKLDLLNEDNGAVMNNDQENDECNKSNSSQVNATPPKKRKAGSRKQQKYRKAWEFYPEFKSWLQSVENDVYKAKCIICGKVLVADLSVIQSHAAAKKHIKNSEQYFSAKETIDNLKDYGRSSGPLPRGLFKRVAPPAESRDVSEDIRLDSLAITDQGDGVLYTPDDNYSDHTHTVDMHQTQLTPQGRKPPESTFISKAIVTRPAPPWKATAIVNGHVTRLELNDYKGRYLILFFYPQNFSAVCPTEILALSDRVLEFRAIQTEIVACSVDSHLSHLAWARTPRGEGGLGNPKIPLLADPTHSIARDYGVLMPDQGHTLRAQFIIDRRGVLRHMLINDLGVGRSIDELLRITQALQHVDETETGCPADWKPGLPCV